jgi:hypothetical protein
MYTLKGKFVEILKTKLHSHTFKLISHDVYHPFERKYTYTIIMLMKVPELVFEW